MDRKNKWDIKNTMSTVNGCIYNLEDYLPSGCVGDFMKMGYSYEDAKTLADLAVNSAVSCNGKLDIAEAVDSLVRAMNNVDVDKLKDLK